MRSQNRAFEGLKHKKDAECRQAQCLQKVEQALFVFHFEMKPGVRKHSFQRKPHFREALEVHVSISLRLRGGTFSLWLCTDQRSELRLGLEKLCVLEWVFVPLHCT